MKYKATIKVLGQFHKAEGSTAIEAISNLKVPLARGTSILILERTMEKGEGIETVKIEKIFGNLLTVRLFSQSPSMREVGLKQAKTLFDAF